MFDRYAHNMPSRFLDEIPARLIEETSYEDGEEREASGWNRSAAVLSGGRSGMIRPGSVKRGYQPAQGETGSPWAPAVSGKPKLTFKGLSLDQIPGVRKGFVPSAAREAETSSLQQLFSPGERVRHPKFGPGTVAAVTGSGKDARIRIRFDDAGEKELALSIAPIVAMEEEA